METLQRQMVGHGLLVIVAALLAGFMLGFGLSVARGHAWKNSLDALLRNN